MFEILVTLCLGAVCAERLLPGPTPLAEAPCIASAPARIEDWTKRHEGYTAGDARCVAAADLADRAAEVIETSPGHFVHEGKITSLAPGSDGDLANTGFIVGDDAVAVIDSGSTRAVAEALYLAVRQVTKKPIRWLILTHMHPDHSLGAEVFREAGAEIVGAESLTVALGSRSAAYMTNLQRLLGARKMLGTAPTLPDRGIAGTGALDLGNRVLELRAHPTAHTNNDLTVLDSASQTIWMGDLVFLTHVPALDGSISGWIRVLNGLEPGMAERMVPGHGPPVAPYPDGAFATRDYLTALAAETRAAIDRGESLRTAVDHIGAGLRGDWRLFDEFNPRNATNAYVELEWE